MKRIYSKPTTEVIRLEEKTQLMYLSDANAKRVTYLVFTDGDGDDYMYWF